MIELSKQNKLSGLSFAALALVIALCVGWLWQTDTIDGTASYVQGYVPHPSGYFQDFTSVTFSE